MRYYTAYVSFESYILNNSAKVCTALANACMQVPFSGDIDNIYSAPTVKMHSKRASLEEWWLLYDRRTKLSELINNLTTEIVRTVSSANIDSHEFATIPQYKSTTLRVFEFRNNTARTSYIERVNGIVAQAYIKQPRFFLKIHVFDHFVGKGSMFC